MRLQFHLQRISILKINLARNAYQIGKELKEIQTERDWKRGRGDHFTNFLNEIGLSSSGWKFLAIFENFTEDEVTKIGRYKAEKLLPLLQQSQSLKPKLIQIAESHSREELKLALEPFRQKYHLVDLHYKLLLTGEKPQLDHINQMLETLRDTKEYGESKSDIVENLLRETIEEIVK